MGLDEAGRGPLCGPVVACAFFFKDTEDVPRVKDSKKLSAGQREKLFEILCVKGNYAVSFASAGEIDEHNILEATMIAFNRAIQKLMGAYPFLKDAEFIIDGPIFRTDLNIHYRCVKKADVTVGEVSSASIIAKVTRDHFMHMLDFLYPQWNFSGHKGYPTKEHRELLQKALPTPFHRRSFMSAHEV
ncbi:MAG: ribonuclease HII [Candidatus Omnitrophica bacterium]|nr:ribonuclease HII [Candidatus Omnitrophota bacterium]